MRKRDLTDAELISLIESEESKAYGINDAELASSRAKSLNYYNGEVEQSAPEGRSNVVSRDVLDVVESALPQLLKIFVSGDEVVRFEPRGYEDVEGAQQETDYTNHVVMEKNNGFAIFYTWFKDGMLSKNGYVKAYYEEKEEVTTETYQGLSDAQLTMLLQDDSIEVIEHSAYPDPYASGNPAQMMQMGAPVLQAPMLHDIKIEITGQRGKIEICNIAPEDILVSTDCRTVSVQDARFVQHRARMTLSEMREQGWDVPDDLGYTDTQSHWEEEIARDLYGEEQDQDEEEVLVKDTYYMVNGKRLRLVIAGSVIVHKDEAEVVPIATLTPHIMPHRHIGMSYADLCMDVQDIKTALVRSQLDNQYLANNGRTAISDKVNLEDLLTSRPGGVVRVQGLPGQEIMPLQHAPLSPTSFSMIEYFDSIKEKRTGITAYNQGMDADTLNKTASGISQIMSAAQQRIELVARTFAETGVKELFMLVHRLIRTHFTKPDIVRLRNKWVEVDPRQWKTRMDMSIAVGLGTGNKDQQLMHLQTILMAQKEALQIGVATPKNIYNALAKLTMNAGFKNPEEFWTEPEDGPFKPAPDQKIEVEKGKLALDKERLEFDKMKALGDYKLKEAEVMKPEAAPDGSGLQEAYMTSQIEAEKIALERDRLELERQKIQLDAETKILIAQMSANRGEDGEPSKDSGTESALAMALQGFQEALMQLRAPRTATMPDGRQIRVE